MDPFAYNNPFYASGLPAMRSPSVRGNRNYTEATRVAIPEMDFSNIPELSVSDQNQLMAYKIFTEDGRFDYSDWEPLMELWRRESNWDHRALNTGSTARGIPQAMGSLNPETMSDEWLNDPAQQIRWGLDYIYNRSQYKENGRGTVAKALQHHDREGWY